jgi:hypothetical protein
MKYLNYTCLSCCWINKFDKPQLASIDWLKRLLRNIATGDRPDGVRYPHDCRFDSFDPAMGEPGKSLG